MVIFNASQNAFYDERLAVLSIWLESKILVKIIDCVLFELADIVVFRSQSLFF